MITTLQVAGLSHSEIRGSTVICTYPRLIAAYHVLHRLREPRHPPDALTYFRLMLKTERFITSPALNLLILSAVIALRLARLTNKDGLRLSVYNLKSFLLTVLCVNMSKISVIGLFYYFTILLLPCGQPSNGQWSNCQMTTWRITDSNR